MWACADHRHSQHIGAAHFQAGLCLMGEREVPCEALTLEEACREKDLLISSLEREVAQQRQLRAQDARQVEAKALRIKDWVAHKLGELELQNAHLQVRTVTRSTSAYSQSFVLPFFYTYWYYQCCK